MTPRVAFAVCLLVLVGCSHEGDEAQARASSKTQAAVAKPSDFTAVELTPSLGDLKPLLQAEAKKAAAKGYKPFVEVYAAWCKPCKELEKSLGNPKMQEAFAGTHQIRLDSDAWGDQLAAAGIPAPAIPVFFELDNSGKPTG
jgi:thiol:disulfide interchange protein